MFSDDDGLGVNRNGEEVTGLVQLSTRSIFEEINVYQEYGQLEVPHQLYSICELGLLRYDYDVKKFLFHPH